MKKILLIFLFIPILLKAQHSTITAGTQASLSIPNLSTQQILAISNPKHGSMVYDTTENCTKVYNGTNWKCTSTALNNAPVNQPVSQSDAIVLQPGNTGMLGLPQLSDAQIKAIAAPRTGSIVYDKSLGCVRYYDGELWRCTNQWKMNYPEALTAWKPSSDESFNGKMAVDPSGNIIMAGYFVNSITLGGTTLSSAGIQQIYCVKYSPGGNVIWAKMFTASNYCNIETIAVGTDGSIYLAGDFTFTLTIGSITVNGHPGTELFIAKLDTNGNAIWAKNMVCDNYIALRSMSLDKQNNPLITGYFGTGNLYLGDSGITLASGPNYTGFLAKCNTFGNFEWGKALPSSWESTCMSTATDDNGNIYLVGYFIGDISFPGGINFSSSGQCDIFIIKYQSNGTFEWVKHEGTASNEFASYVVFAQGKLLIVGITDNGTTIGGFSLPSQLSNTFETFYASLNVTDQTWNWAYKADGYTYPTNAIMHNDTEFYMLGHFTNHRITTFGSKSVWGDGGATFIVKGNMSNGNISYFRKMLPEAEIQNIVPFGESKKLISGIAQFPVKLGDAFLTSPGNNFQAFVGIITE